MLEGRDLDVLALKLGTWRTPSIVNGEGGRFSNEALDE